MSSSGGTAVGETPHLTPARRAEHAAQQKRLAKALRDNLRRRKEQARDRERSVASSDADPAADEPRG